MTGERPRKGYRDIGKDAIARVAGVIAAFTPDEAVRQPLIAERAKLSRPTVSKVVAGLIEQELLEVEGLHKARSDRGGRPTVLLRVTPEFTAQVAARSDWQREAHLQELIQDTGMDEGQVMDVALELAREALLQHPWRTGPPPSAVPPEAS